MDKPKVRLLGQQPALDGVRGVALIAILAFHGDVDAFGGGYVALEAFFVLSGFLITSLLLAERETRGRLDFRAFYTRRALRLFPAIFLCVGIVWLVGSLLPGAPETEHLSRDAAATILYSVNWVFAFQDQFPFGVFDHMWSLSIEEQYYLVWPVTLLAILYVTRHRRGLSTALVFGLFLLSTAFHVWLFNDGASLTRVTFGTDVRAAPILVGCGAGMLLTWDLLRPSRAVNASVAVLGTLGTLALIYMTFGDRYSFESIRVDPALLHEQGYTIAALGSVTTIVWAVMQPRNPVARVLALRPIVWLGKVSYSTYLWHVPVFLLLSPKRLGLTDMQALPIRLVVAFAFASASYYFVEKPALRLKKRYERRPDRDRRPAATAGTVVTSSP